MTCTNCGTELPAGAMFCGECGRAVTAAGAATPGRGKAKRPIPTPPASRPPATKPIPVVEDLVEPSSRLSEPAEIEPERRVSVRSEVPVRPAPPAAVVAPADMVPIDEVVSIGPLEPEEDLSVERCAQCGSILEPSDIFCGECGFVRHNPNATPRPHDTVAFDPFPWGLPRSTEAPVGGQSGEVPQSIEPEPSAEPDAVVPASTPDVAVSPEIVVEPPVEGESDADDEHDIDATRIVDRAASGERFVLQFSTGESVSVTGTGLLGRNPVAEPGEYFDLLLPISDPGKSVSKTHLEFGQEGGAFWVSDRFSGNGTVVREPERQPRRCDPGKRYRLLRGTRVDIGEQFFIVS